MYSNNDNVFYNLTGRKHNDWCLHIKQITPEIIEQNKPRNFYFNIADSIFDGIKFENCLDPNSIKTLRKFNSSSLTIDFNAEPFYRTELDSIYQFYIDNGISLSKLFFCVQDELQKKFIYNYLSEYGLHKENIAIYPRHYTYPFFYTPIQSNLLEHKKFCMLIRRHEDNRLRFLLNLWHKNILKDTHFTYQAMEMDIATVTNYTRNVREDTNLSLTDHELEFINNIPFRLDSSDTGDPQDQPIITEAIVKSDFSIVVETVIDQKLYYNDLKDISNFKWGKYFSPTDISEKTFNVVSAGKPFFVVATPHWLQDFRYLGFKTFAPYIDESYDRIYPINKRLAKITDEIRRIQNLPPDEYEKVREKCNQIAQENKIFWQEKVDHYLKTGNI